MTEPADRASLVKTLDLDPRVSRLKRALAEAGVGEAWLVGGFVRDAAVHVEKEKIDLDLAIPVVTGELACDLARRINGSGFPLDEDSGALRITLDDGSTVDLVPFRGETIENDLAGRDFTINAIAYDLVGGRGVIDPLGGLYALDRKFLALCSDESLQNDPLRTLRAYRFAATLGMRFGPGLTAAIKAAASGLGGVAAERMRYELFRLLDGPFAGVTLRRASGDGMLDSLFPSVRRWRGFDQGSYHEHDLMEHCLLTVEHLERVLDSRRLEPYGDKLLDHLALRHEADVTRLSLLKFAALFHDVAKPETLVVENGGRRRFIGHDAMGAKMVAALLVRLKCGRKTARAGARIVAAHMRLFGLAAQENPTRRSRLRYLRDIGDETPETALLSISDELATGAGDGGDGERFFDTAREILGLFFDREGPVEPLVRGRDLMEHFGAEEGPAIGLALAAVADAESRGEVSSREEALAFAGSFIEKFRTVSPAESREAEKSQL